ncbi:GTPase-associated system all-helical protein GASH [Flavobacterium collinsii]|uniref:GTPase-associated system helical domain-containing protein n=1 Tax=Flavobacterium collinsii TaxID=1114861 RepID=A0ABN7EP91_9FLAO|nr:GTPase-associated system all-helical protein GASH [Flavobacterium collinsii]CAA9200816.1 hypothetical protein FLACOL7796_03446 [Flavobacterium collinsii]
MIQDYLNSNLISIVADDDFKKLKKSADDITKKLLKSKAKIQSFTLTAINPNSSADNPNIVEVKDIIIKNWSTFLSNTKDTPLTFIKAVMLEALRNVCVDINNSLVIWFTARNVVKYFSLIGEEKRIIFEFLSNLGHEIDRKANTEWALSDEKMLIEKVFNLKEISKYLLNDDNLIKYLEDAVGPTNSEGKSNFSSPNPHLPDEPEEWSHEFPSRAAKGIKNSVDASLKAIVTTINENKEVVQNALNEIDQIKKNSYNRDKAAEIKSELLWWKEASYSKSANLSYDEIDQNILSVVLAYDFSAFIPAIYPQAVDYFLKGTYKALKDSSDEVLTIENFILGILKHSEQLKAIFEEGIIAGNECCLLSFCNSLYRNQKDISQFEANVGIPLSTKISRDEFLNWFFHDFQSEKILNIK